MSAVLHFQPTLYFTYFFVRYERVYDGSRCLLSVDVIAAQDHV